MDIKFKNVLIRHVNYQDCEACDNCKEILAEYKIRHETLTCNKDTFGQVMKFTGSNGVPQVILKGEFIGGYDELKAHLESQ